jgi:hypothetical protein
MAGHEIVPYSTDAQAIAGSDTASAVTPAGLTARLNTDLPGKVNHALAEATNDFLVGNTGGGTFIKKTLAEAKAILAVTDFGVIHATFKSPTDTFGAYHAFGFYEAPATQKAFTNAATTQTLGSANNAYEAHVFIVAKEAGTASGGATGTAKITITGTSMTSGGVRAAGDSEILVADVTTLSANQYVESTKMWIGQVTLTLAATGDHTTFTATVNYGLSSAQHFFEHDVIINQFECTGRAGATDSAFNIQLLKHSSTGWTFSAAAFAPGGTVLLNMNTDFNTEKNITQSKRFHYHRKGLTTAINGTAREGVVARITTGIQNAVESMDMRIQFTWA